MNLRSLTLCMLSGALLVACSSPEDIAARRAQLEAADHHECLQLGYKPNTPTYGDCRLRLRELRIQAEAVKRQPVLYPHVGIHYGYHRWR